MMHYLYIWVNLNWTQREWREREKKWSITLKLPKNSVAAHVIEVAEEAETTNDANEVDDDGPDGDLDGRPTVS